MISLSLQHSIGAWATYTSKYGCDMLQIAVCSYVCQTTLYNLQKGLKSYKDTCCKVLGVTVGLYRQKNSQSFC